MNGGDIVGKCGDEGAMTEEEKRKRREKNGNVREKGEGRSWMGGT